MKNEKKMCVHTGCYPFNIDATVPIDAAGKLKISFLSKKFTAISQ